MKTKSSKLKFLFIILVLALTAGVFTLAASAAYLGSAGEALANDISLIKTGLLGQKITFSDTDFKTALGIPTFKKVTVLSLPASSEGVLMLSERRVGVGQSINRRELCELYFIPADENVTESSFTFKVSGTSEESILCTLKFISKVNFAPKLDTDTEKSLTVTTQKDIAVYGEFSVSDPEGDAIDYIIVSYPKYGTLKITNEENGEFKYTPGKNFCGNDSFVFAARDEYGNYSETKKVSIKIIERMSDVIYIDMEDTKEYNAAVAMTAMGIMSGTRIGDDMYFSPDDSVTRAEFVAMAMKSVGMRQESELSSTFFDDNEQIPKSLMGYVATAAKRGIVNGSFDGKELNFRPNDSITYYEAAIVMANILNVKAESQVFSSIEKINDVPVWARPKVGAMYELGVFSYGEDIDMNSEINRSSTAMFLYKLSSIR